MKALTAVTSALLLMLLLLAGCASASTGVPTPTGTGASGTPDPLTILQQRPLHRAALPAGEACVVRPGTQVSPDLGPALGPGPIYLIGYGTQGSISISGSRADGGWYYLKTLWAAPPDFHGVFLLRGRQVDGPNEVRFSPALTADPDPQAAFSSEQAGTTASGWLPWIDYVRVRAPGCYGMQVDGLSFSEFIRFQVVNTP